MWIYFNLHTHKQFCILFPCLIVAVNITPSSAHFGTDYESDVTTLLFANSQTSATFEIGIINDDVTEPNEEFRVAIKVQEGGKTGSQNQMTVIIVDDDGTSSGNVSTPSSGKITKLNTKLHEIHCHMSKLEKRPL